MYLFLYNTLTRSKQAFEPADPRRVTMYVCGPTVYNYAHIGNARPAVVFDVLFRLLRHQFGKKHVVYARNFTDVDDKINAAAAEQGVPINTITNKYKAIYRQDMGGLGVLDPSLEPCATDHIPQMINMIERLISNKHAYHVDGHVLFHVPSYNGYGQLSGRNRDDMIAGARVEVAPYKKDPADFVLWKPSTPKQPGWNSPWGRGRPGWHIECSSMIEEHLGETIDIHCGGHDLIFPHHENELAQSSCAHGGATFAQVWMHNGFLTMNKEKMAKSVGNVVAIHELLEKYRGEAIRLALLSAHYRQPLDWSDETILQAWRRLDNLYDFLDSIENVKSTEVDPPTAFTKTLMDDLNTPKALAVLSDMVGPSAVKLASQNPAKAKSELQAAGKLLGILQEKPDTWLRAGPDRDEIQALVDERERARSTKNFSKADEIRSMLTDRKIEVRDRLGSPPRWLRRAATRV
ncbi:MAG: cysteine--tRNA ligase [Candidatus Marinimicrobia bacterium]|nr:cysteine--tRNA ligase [Candidatus Neomarinimicrobiota bacterium]